jgi:hypothetical protein
MYSFIVKLGRLLEMGNTEKNCPRRGKMRFRSLGKPAEE